MMHSRLDKKVRYALDCGENSGFSHAIVEAWVSRVAINTGK
jgi:hypothetical protein